MSVSGSGFVVVVITDHEADNARTPGVVSFGIASLLACVTAVAVTITADPPLAVGGTPTAVDIKVATGRTVSVLPSPPKRSPGGLRIVARDRDMFADATATDCALADRACTCFFSPKPSGAVPGSMAVLVCTAGVMAPRTPTAVMISGRPVIGRTRLHQSDTQYYDQKETDKQFDGNSLL